jgi:retron-type reverse transcriptase
MIALWTLRNVERHGRDKETWEQARQEVLTNKLQILYHNRGQYPIGVKISLQTTFENHCRDKASAIKDWLNAFCVTFQVMHIQPSG